MGHVQEIMTDMRDSVEESEKTSHVMVGKLGEIAQDVGNIDKIVGKLVEQIGNSGFMDVKDVQPGMQVICTDQSSKDKYRTFVEVYFAMKRIAMFMSALALAAVSFMSCDKNENGGDEELILDGFYVYGEATCLDRVTEKGTPRKNLPHHGKHHGRIQGCRSRFRHSFPHACGNL